jgi:hypothetical protein
LLEEFSEAIFIILLFSVDPFEIYDNRPLKYGGKQKKNPEHGLINYIESKAKCRHLKILTCKRTLQQVLIRVYRLEKKVEIESIKLVFSTQLCKLLPLKPSLWFNSTQPSPPSMCE